MASVSSEADAESVMDASFGEKQADLRKDCPVILVVGAKGVGKRTLVGAVFGSTEAETAGEDAGAGAGVGAGAEGEGEGGVSPVWSIPEAAGDSFTLVSRPGAPVTLIHSEGWERGGEEEGRRETRALRTALPIDAAWVLVDAATARIHDWTVAFVRDELQGIPTFVCISRIDKVTEPALASLRAAVETAFANVVDVRSVIPLAARPQGLLPFPSVCPACGSTDLALRPKSGQWRCEGCEAAGARQPRAPVNVTELVVATGDSLEREGVAESFAAVQTVSSELREREAYRLVTSRAIVASGVGAVPIPFIDTPILMGLDLSLVSQLGAIYGVKIGYKTAYKGLGAVGGTVGFGAAAGRLMGTALKFIPGLGSLVGGAITASIAGTVTYALGAFWIRALGPLADALQGMGPAEAAAYQDAYFASLDWEEQAATAAAEAKRDWAHKREQAQAEATAEEDSGNPSDRQTDTDD